MHSFTHLLVWGVGYRVVAKQGFSFMELIIYLGGAYNKQEYKQKYTVMNCDTCKKGNDQNAMGDNIL